MLTNTFLKLFLGLLAFTVAAVAQVSYKEIVNSLGTPRDWLTYSGAYNGWRYTGLREINAENVKRLTVKWVFQPPASLDEFEATPLVKDGIMYLPAQGN